MVVISATSSSATFLMSINDDKTVEGVEQVTIITSGAIISELEDEMVDKNAETVVFIEDNDGMYEIILTCIL